MFLKDKIASYFKKNGFPATIKYIDPYGGFIREGKIEASPGAFNNSPFVTANLPDALVGKSLVKKNEPTTITLSAVIGIW